MLTSICMVVFFSKDISLLSNISTLQRKMILKTHTDIKILFSHLMRSKEGNFQKLESAKAAIEPKLVSIYDSDKKN